MTSRADPAPVRILLVEDNPGDARLTRELLRDSRIANSMRTVPNGVEAMALLRQQGPYKDEPRPHLILLDLNLPRKDGREVLAELKCDASLRQIPVVVLTSSRAEDDVSRSYDLHANGYVTKPVGLDHFADAVRGIEEFWLATARLPAEPAP